MEISRVEMGGDLYPGSLYFKVLQMPDFTRNAFNVAHGGALTTYVDIATTAATFAFDKKSRTQVSAGLDIQFFNPGVIGRPMMIEARVTKIGKNISYSKADLTCLETGQLICSGTHIKAFVDKEYDLMI